ncbi:glycoside hydrolase family 19 protein [Paraburkholderia sp. SOS3]|uniref:glycoside hydrolase family 19 protein n=1 Tax=Paraburkholderia sp. SOS3 TaxID=1926494 RepID=UPI000947321A|nr:chitinase [Paraburkholderia sp. SOS3]APR39609.1 chitinase [Paraburkholderia sp. SOS3]
MTTKHTPKQSAQAPQPAKPRLRELQFAFPFLRKAEGKAQKASPFTDEHEIHRLLAEREPSGSYPVSRSGMWHGGIHITEAGAGRAMDLDAGLRALADGHLIAYRANRAYPVSEFAAPGGGTVRAPYSTGFALLRHSMEFPRGSALTFYSLYMHLMSDEDYANFPARGKPSYWTRQWLVTSFARDRPVIGRNGQAADARQLGLRVRTAPTPHSNAIGILPQGASVSIGKKEKGWGQLKDLHGAQLHPPIAGTFVSASAAIGGWICMGQENGGPLVDEVFPDAAFDQVVITAAAHCRPDDAQGAGFCVRAGDPIGHMGRYDALTEGGASGTRMAHIEVFCDGSIRPFIEQSRAWISQHGPHREDWSELGLPADPTILRIGPNTVLNQRNGDTFAEGMEPQSRKTDVVQVYPLAGLARDRSRHYAEPEPDPIQQRTVNWWLVQSANMLGHPIEGWVRESSHKGGMVTREFSRKWIDFRCIEDAHDATHTIFANSAQWIDYASHAEVADTASRAKLSPLMLKVYDALFTRGDGRQAAVELCSLSKTERGGYPWLVQAASRLIVKHGSEWANPAKWTKLIAELDQRTGTKPQREEELKRIGKLAWWDEVKARVPGFPEPDVFHIHPIGLAGNFQRACFRFTLQIVEKVFPSARAEDLQELVDELNAHIETYELDSPLRRTHFFAQVAQEAGPSLTLEESFVWKASSLIATFSYFRRNPDQAVHGYENVRPIKADGTRMTQEDFEAIANGAYGGRVDLGNGDYKSGDGWKYRGRGMKQLTGRTHYREFTKWNKNHQSEWPEDIVDFETNPDLLIQPKYAARSAAYFWVSNGLANIADQGATSKQVDAITAIVNLYTDSYQARFKNFEVFYNRGDFN